MLANIYRENYTKQPDYIMCSFTTGYIKREGERCPVHVRRVVLQAVEVQEINDGLWDEYLSFSNHLSDT